MGAVAVIHARLACRRLKGRRTFLSACAGHRPEITDTQQRASLPACRAAGFVFCPLCGSRSARSRRLPAPFLPHQPQRYFVPDPAASTRSLPQNTTYAAADAWPGSFLHLRVIITLNFGDYHLAWQNRTQADERLHPMDRRASCGPSGKTPETAPFPPMRPPDIPASAAPAPVPAMAVPHSSGGAVFLRSGLPMAARRVRCRMPRPWAGCGAGAPAPVCPALPAAARRGGGPSACAPLFRTPGMGRWQP